jgi:hypothetical protein
MQTLKAPVQQEAGMGAAMQQAKPAKKSTNTTS